ncbi:MAG TPA: glycosyltransferase, partial [Firmicutes bacterium]|nr:glycosyltransferase [Bacillota bacterium]
GLPIVTTDVGGQTDFLKAERNALLVPPGDPGALEEALRRIIEERELRCRLGENNRSDIAPRSFDTMIDRYEQLFEQVIRKERR